ncbi:SDR family NAD(P)-dependent oxidoreductase [Rhodocytophaga rosea]|uniref:SDR family NAD(P)-dependent oxidoreductase n=1 Tax=Rhodocytophaga rosea TaxID=2704465 RepID=A0A6C0GP92_9BACT|nr:SDR family NAD(P)-dependent oxidoreductase [Rhodocytophaga rosea]QHT69674.1 SDR family NAD(P)-dependent oxidoreductase [Rhodocytophaga rosea]
MKQLAIVTGVSGNLGQAVAQNLLQKDIQVIGTIRTEESLPELEKHSHFEKYTLDVTQEEACKQLVTYAANTYGKIHIAALTVGGFAMGNLQETDGASLKKMFAMNFESAYYLAREVFVQMAKHAEGGHIFLVGARPALLPEAGKHMVAYALSKSLLFSLAEILNAEGNKKNVVTTVIVPSTIDTPQNRVAMPDAKFANWVQPSDIAEIISFTASDAAKVIREPVIKVYGNA